MVCSTVRTSTMCGTSAAAVRQLPRSDVVRQLLAATLGVLIGQWLAFGAAPSPAGLYALGMSAAARHDDAEALRIWSRAASLHPDNAAFHYRRGEALAGLGHRQSAAEAYGLALRLTPPPSIERLAREGLERLEAVVTSTDALETVVALEDARGVWIVPVLLNDSRPARFLLDTGSSVTLVSPLVGAEVLGRLSSGETVELQALSGRTTGHAARLTSIRIGGAEVRDVPVVLHDPGPGIDGILGNTVLGRYRLTLDSDRGLLRLAGGR
jgi:predicted aspartyl protease